MRQYFKGMRHLKSFASSFPIAVAVYDLQTGEYHFVTDDIEDVIGYRPKEIKEGGLEFVMSLIHPEDVERINAENEKEAEYIHKNPDRVKSYWADFQYRMKHKDGHWVKVHTRGRAFSLDDEGKVKRILNFTFDADKNTTIDFKELGKIALFSFDHFTEMLSHDLKGHVHVLEFIVNELVQDSMDIENLSHADLKDRMVTNSIAISEVSTKLSNLLKNLS